MPQRQLDDHPPRPTSQRAWQDRWPREHACPPAVQARDLEIRNPALTRAVAACTACNGRWGREGMLGLEGCNCRPIDAGKVCHDGDECEGVCLPDGVEVITKARPITCDRRGKCSAFMGSGRLVGHCSDRMVVFGCHGEIPRGASKQPPAWLPIHSGSICVD